ncbi:FMN-binding negative transcriptional regulator [Geopsychrobacter electrodiphilus]|uniref:FMN-binding negative transcriptional regulator n=1 Tax=Geopsychrobacter electrodiphilus TaxID=225196 RepID=UPI00037A566A|nr:FMN-binding negative transcriptional regulator [Geopsychrobacter electrodiphilus]
MYVPELFAEPDTEVMHEVIRARPMATLVTLNAAGLEANHIPLVLQAQPDSLGVLQGHVARSNPLWHEHPQNTEVLVIFQGPESYVTPSWYASKAEHGKVVPTWNYVSVHARGKLRVFEDVGQIRSQLEALTAQSEAAFAHQWRVSDAPQDFVEKLIESIVGIEIVITELKGKWKVSQNRPPEDRASVIAGLSEMGKEEMADLVRTRGGKPNQQT